MDPQEKLRLLKSLHLLDQVPQDKLAALADFLKPLSLKDGQSVFEEGSKGDSLFFISSGHIRIQKQVILAGAPAFKDLAILGPGDCFGEMALFDEVPRSARAAAEGSAVVFQLGREDLQRWLKSHPGLAIGFFTELVQVLSKRLRRSSNELTLLYDLSQRLLEPVKTGKDLLQVILRHLVPHLDGSWAAGAFLYNEFNDELEMVAKEGDFQPSVIKAGASNAWLDDHNYIVVLQGARRASGYLLFRTPAALGGEEKNEIGRTLTTTGRLITSALENIGHRTEDSMRQRLAASRQHGSGL